MTIKKKSLVVALTSGIIISCVLVLTLVCYIVYGELKAEQFRHRYYLLLTKIHKIP